MGRNNETDGKRGSENGVETKEETRRSLEKERTKGRKRRGS